MFLKLTKIQRAGALLALLFSVQATSANLSQTQSCVLKGVLTGDSRHFWFWGRDSWVGKVDIICEPESPRRTVRPPENPKNDRKIERYEVILRFSPWSPGIGSETPMPEAGAITRPAGPKTSRLPRRRRTGRGKA